MIVVYLVRMVGAYAMPANMAGHREAALLPIRWSDWLTSNLLYTLKSFVRMRKNHTIVFLMKSNIIPRNQISQIVFSKQKIKIGYSWEIHVTTAFSICFVLSGKLCMLVLKFTLIVKISEVDMVNISVL